ncbi:MAG: citrate (Si)-synthase [bacterium]|nr:citrate (Si)-synthase [bacterium]MDE0642637.1 citrate (Si)-synthase [bacterium]MYD05112.1 citrate (Si)-synthase [Acidimicrobiia bacterium]
MEKAALRLDEEEVIDLPVASGTDKQQAIDIQGLRAATGLVTLDPGYANTAETTSSVTFIDGEAGVLRYRGYPVDQLVDHSSFLEVAYLLDNAELPTDEELDYFRNRVSEHCALPKGFEKVLESVPDGTHPMQKLAVSVTLLGSSRSDRPKGSEAYVSDFIRLIAMMPTLVAWSYRSGHDQVYIKPDPDLGYVANFLNMTFHPGQGDYRPTEAHIKAMEALLILHADHGQNLSTSAVRLVGSGRTDVYSSICAGVLALSGPLHGGANQRVIEMLEEILAAGGNTRLFMDRAKDREDPFRLMGFGHRVYKNVDPRALIIKRYARDMVDKNSSRLFDLAMRLEKEALADDFFVSRRIYPNVDYYSGIIYQAMGFPTEMFTVLFALGRLPGWLSQLREMMRESNAPIKRPRQLYTGYPKRDFPTRSDR